VREHAIFERDGSPLSCEVPVSFATATLGGPCEVPTLGGNVDLKVPARRRSGRVFRCARRASAGARRSDRRPVLPRRGGTPVNLTDDQKGLLRKLEESMRSSTRNHSPRQHSWLDGVKRFFERCAAERHERARAASRDLRRVRTHGARSDRAAVEESPDVCRARARRLRPATPRRRLSGADVPSSSPAPGDCRPSRRLRRGKAADRHRYDRTRRGAARADRAAAKQIAIVLAPNMSLGVNLLLKLVELTAGKLDASYDIEVFEAHHRNKKDAPSVRRWPLARQPLPRAREAERRPPNTHATAQASRARRGQSAFRCFAAAMSVGDHTVTFAGVGERIELTHRASDRLAFARGARPGGALGRRPSARPLLHAGRVGTCVIGHRPESWSSMPPICRLPSLSTRRNFCLRDRPESQSRCQHACLKRLTTEP
jgi:hypothetical protein